MIDLDEEELKVVAAITAFGSMCKEQSQSPVDREIIKACINDANQSVVLARSSVE